MISNVLIVDDEIYICRLLGSTLSDQGYECTLASNAEDAWKLLQQKEFALMLCDITLPGMSGLELLTLTRAKYPNLAVVMVTAHNDRRMGLQALRLGALGYVTKPFDLNEITINAANALERRRLFLENQEREQHLETQIAKRTEDLRKSQEELAWRLVWAAERRDPESAGHIRRIGLYSSMLATALGWTEPIVSDLRISAMMHDIGKIGIPDAILFKPGRLTVEEFKVMKTHPEIGASILQGSEIPFIQLAGEVALNHHERWDGSGYPRGLAGPLIPESARIVAIVDVFDALTTKRLYRNPVSESEAVEEMVRARGSHFDPLLFDLFVKLVPHFRPIPEQDLRRS